jgi:Fic family protein
LTQAEAAVARSGGALTCPPLPVAAAGANRSGFQKPTADGFTLNVIGLELRVAFALVAMNGAARADNDFWRRKCRELCLRPAIEPLLLAHWAKLKAFEMTETMLCGSKQQARTKDSYGLWDGGNVRFEPAEQAKHWWADIQSVANRAELAPLLPAYAFARTIIAHPYPDGNGRIARALVHAALARQADLPAPTLALGPAFYVHGAKVAAALRALSDTGDWEEFDAMFGAVLQDAVRLTKAVKPSRE